MKSHKGSILEVARLVRDSESVSRAEIARRLEMNPATVGRFVDILLAENLLSEGGQKQGNGAGRPSTGLDFNARAQTVLTVDLRLTHAYAAVTDLAGNILVIDTQALTVEDPRQSLVELMSLIHRLAQTAGATAPLAAIAIGAPSIVNASAGILEWAPSLNWSNLPLKQIIEQEFQIPALVENDVNLAALGEYWKGAGKHAVNNMVFVSLGTGIGAGIIVNGDLYRGASFGAGEVGYFITDVHVLRENAGRLGSLESRVGRSGLIGMAQIVAQRYPTSALAELFNRNYPRVHTRDIIDLAAGGDVAASVVFSELVDNLTVVICNISVLLDPEMIVVGGPSNWEWPPIITAIQSRIGTALLRPIQLIPSSLGNNAVILGGAYSALELLPIFLG